MEKLYYVVPRDIAFSSAKHFVTSAWIDLDEAHVLLAAEPRGHAARELFERHCSAEVFDPIKHSAKIRKHPHFANVAAVDILDRAKTLHKGFR